MSSEARPQKNVLPFRSKKKRNLDQDLKTKDAFMDRVAHVIKHASDVPVMSPNAIIALNVDEEGAFHLMVLPPESYTPAQVILSADQLYSLIHALDYILSEK